MKKAVRPALLVLLGVAIGYYLHTPIEGYILSTQQIAGLAPSPSANTHYDPQKEFIKYVDYKNGQFSTTEVTVHKGSYLAVTNTSKDNSEKMWLVSDYPELNTQRDYFSSERVQVAMQKPGTYTVQNRENHAAFKVTVQ